MSMSDYDTFKTIIGMMESMADEMGAPADEAEEFDADYEADKELFAAILASMLENISSTSTSQQTE